MKKIDIRKFVEALPYKSNYKEAEVDQFTRNIEDTFEKGAPYEITLTKQGDRSEIVFKLLNADKKKSPSYASRSHSRLENQVEALRWLQGKCEDQFVSAWIGMCIESMERAGGTPESS